MTLTMILLVAAFVLFLLAGFNVGHSRISLGWFGAACATLALVLGK